MLITAKQDATNWRCFYEGQIEIRLNGRAIDFVRSCDDEEGWVDVFRTEEGKPVLRWVDGHRDYIIDRLCGKVEIVGTRRSS